MSCTSRMILLHVTLGFFSNHQRQGQMVQIHLFISIAALKIRDSFISSYTIGWTGRFGPYVNTSWVVY